MPVSDAELKNLGIPKAQWPLTRMLFEQQETAPTPYEQALEQYADTAGDPGIVPPTGGPKSAAFGYVAPEGPDYTLGAESGGVRFKNGVIANPQTNEIYFPPNETVVGSEPWLRGSGQVGAGQD